MAEKKRSLNPNKPLGLRAGKGPTKSEAVKVTDNSNGWAQVANIPVPPDADKRDFSGSLGESPVLVNGKTLPKKTHNGPEETTVSQGFLPSVEPVPVKESSISKTITVEINWYGALLAIDCLNAIYQPPNYNKGIDGLLLLELPLLEKTKAPAWTPPLAQLDQNGKMHIPEFECTVSGQTLKCQVLNIDIYDKKQNKRLFIFRVSDFTE